MPRDPIRNPNNAASSDRFGRFATAASGWLGSKWGFLCAGIAIVAWAITGPIFHFNEYWQLVMNTATDVLTFLMVFLLQNTQNRDARAINLKLDELIHSVDKASNHMINIERLSDSELDVLEKQFRRLRAAGTRDASAERHESAAD